jgi:hypothetical protein
MRNTVRLRRGPQAGDGDRLVGDYTNPILRPWAAEKNRAAASHFGLTEQRFNGGFSVSLRD